MKQKEIKIIENYQLKQHEEVGKNHLLRLLEQIKQDGFIDVPLVVDQNTGIILDGHHRFNVIKQLGLGFSPCILVDYASSEIEVAAWQKGQTVTKNTVIEAGLSGNLLKPRTSKHSIPNVPEGLKIPLSKLKPRP